MAGWSSSCEASSKIDGFDDVDILGVHLEFQPVLPVTILGGHDAWPLGQALPRPGRLSIVYHPVIAPPDATDSRAAARTLARQVRDAIASRLPPAQQPAADL